MYTIYVHPIPQGPHEVRRKGTCFTSHSQSPLMKHLLPTPITAHQHISPATPDPPRLPHSPHSRASNPVQVSSGHTSSLEAQRQSGILNLNAVRLNGAGGFGHQALLAVKPGHNGMSGTPSSNHVKRGWSCYKEKAALPGEDPPEPPSAQARHSWLLQGATWWQEPALVELTPGAMLGSGAL